MKFSDRLGIVLLFLCVMSMIVNTHISGVIGAFSFVIGVCSLLMDWTKE